MEPTGPFELVDHVPDRGPPGVSASGVYMRGCWSSFDPSCAKAPSAGCALRRLVFARRPCNRIGRSGRIAEWASDAPNVACERSKSAIDFLHLSSQEDGFGRAPGDPIRRKTPNEPRFADDGRVSRTACPSQRWRCGRQLLPGIALRITECLVVLEFARGSRYGARLAFRIVSERGCRARDRSLGVVG